MVKQLFVDVETTDLNPNLGNITELAFIYRVNGKIKKTKEYKGNEYDIYNAFLRDLDSIIDRYDKDDKLYLIGHNSRFDSEFIRAMFKRNRNEYYGSYFMNIPIDTAHIATEYFMNKRNKPENYKLVTLLKYFKIPFEEGKLHGALYDVRKTKELYNVLKKKK